jgi:hypothetical protein
MLAKVLLKNWSEMSMVSLSMIFFAPTGTALGVPSTVDVERTTVGTLLNSSFIRSVIWAMSMTSLAGGYASHVTMPLLALKKQGSSLKELE